MERGLAAPTRRMFVIWGLHGEGRCHGGVVTAFFVDTSGESPTCADKRTERVGLGRSRTRPNPTAQLSLGAGTEPAPASFPVSAPLSGASCFMVGIPGVAAKRAPQGDSDSQGRAEVHSLGFFLGLDRTPEPATRCPSLRERRDSSLSLRGNSRFRKARSLSPGGTGFFFST